MTRQEQQQNDAGTQGHSDTATRRPRGVAGNRLLKLLSASLRLWVSASLLLVASCFFINPAAAQSPARETRLWLLKQARARLGGKAIDLRAAPREALASRRTSLFITTFTRGLMSRPVMGTGDTLAAALRAALDEMTATVRAGQPANAASPSHRADDSPLAAPERIQIDILDGTRAPLNKPSYDERNADPDVAQWIKVGEEGIAFEREGRVIYLLPSEMTYRAIFDDDADDQAVDDLLDRATAYLNFARDDWRSAGIRLSRFHTIAFVEDSTRSAPLDLTAGIVPVINRARLIESARAGGDYLARAQQPDGRFDYSYDPLEDRFGSREYNILRHAGAALALLQLYQVTRDRQYLDAARRAVDYLKTRFRGAKTGDAVYVLDHDGKAKLGANGLALVVLARQSKLDPQSADRENAARLASLILAMQREDGSFASYYRLDGAEPEGSASLYYPGEAILGLVEFYRLTDDRQWLAAARRGAKYLIAAESQMTELPPDAWLMQALAALYDIEHDASYARHALALADAMIADQYTEKDATPFVGAFRPGVPRATPAASRAEGLLAAYRLARLTGDRRAARIAGALKLSARFQLSQQFNADNSFFIPNPKRAAGGFREAVTSLRIRIDFVQHNISALLGVAGLP